MVIAKKETECHLALQISVIHKQLAEALLIKALVLPMSELCFLGFFFLFIYFTYLTHGVPTMNQLMLGAWHTVVNKTH